MCNLVDPLAPVRRFFVDDCRLGIPLFSRCPLGVSPDAFKGAKINVGRLDPTGVDGAYYSVSLGDLIR